MVSRDKENYKRKRKKKGICEVKIDLWYRLFPGSGQALPVIKKVAIRKQCPDSAIVTQPYNILHSTYAALLQVDVITCNVG